MFVEELGTESSVVGWLHSFGIDRHALKPQHRSWIDRRIIGPLQKGSADSRWQVWVVGSASRTASHRHNFDLGKRRAQATHDYIASKAKGATASLAISNCSLSELPAIVKGRKDDVENALDRAVLVTAQKASKKKPIPPPIPVPVLRGVSKVRRLTQFLQIEVVNLSSTGSWSVYIGERYERIDRELGFPYISGSIHPLTGVKGHSSKGSVFIPMPPPAMTVSRYTLGWRKASAFDKWDAGVDKVIPIIFGLLGEHGDFDRRGVKPALGKSPGVYESWAEFRTKYSRNLSEYNEFKKRFGGARYGAP